MTLTLLATAASIMLVIAVTMVLFRGRHSSEITMRMAPFERH
jgi:hypothetical protein